MHWGACWARIKLNPHGVRWIIFSWTSNWLEIEIARQIRKESFFILLLPWIFVLCATSLLLLAGAGLLACWLHLCVLEMQLKPCFDKLLTVQ